MRGDGQAAKNDNTERLARPGGHSRQKQDLTGQKYGHLTVTGPAANVGGRTVWRCKCDCGRETVVKSYHLKDGHAVSCGCVKSGRRMRRNNASGATGVRWNAARKRWVASIYAKGKHKYLGCYGDFDEAVEARRKAEEAVYAIVLDELADGSDQDG